MSVHSEYWLSAFLYLYCNYNELDDNKDNGHIKKTKFVHQLIKNDTYEQCDMKSDSDRHHKVLKILKQKFNDFRTHANRKQIVKIDRVSENLKAYFMDYIGLDIHAKEKYIISAAKIVKIFPNVEEIHFINPNLLNNDQLTGMLTFIQRHTECKLKKIK